MIHILEVLFTSICQQNIKNNLTKILHQVIIGYVIKVL